MCIHGFVRTNSSSESCRSGRSWPGWVLESVPAAAWNARPGPAHEQRTAAAVRANRPSQPAVKLQAPNRGEARTEGVSVERDLFLHPQGCLLNAALLTGH